MSMSRKHYVDAAATVGGSVTAAKALTPVRRRAALNACEEIAGGLAYMFKCDNPRFRYDTFFVACGLDEFGKAGK